jgi:hypothetical protein
MYHPPHTHTHTILLFFLRFAGESAVSAIPRSLRPRAPPPSAAPPPLHPAAAPKHLIQKGAESQAGVSTRARAAEKATTVLRFVVVVVVFPASAFPRLLACVFVSSERQQTFPRRFSPSHRYVCVKSRCILQEQAQHTGPAPLGGGRRERRVKKQRSPRKKRRSEKIKPTPITSVFALFTPSADLSASYDTRRIAFCGTTLIVLALHPR